MECRQQEAKMAPLDYLAKNVFEPCRCAEVLENDGKTGSLLADFHALLGMHGSDIEARYVMWYTQARFTNFYKTWTPTLSNATSIVVATLPLAMRWGKLANVEQDRGRILHFLVVRS